MACLGVRVVSLLLIVGLCSGCLTSAVRDYWLARDRVSAIGFELGEGDRVRWSVFGGDARRDGGFLLAATRADCDRDTVHVVGRGGLDLVSAGRMAFSLLDPRRVARLYREVEPSPCRTVITLDAIGVRHDPRFTIHRGDAKLGVLDVEAPRRRAAGLLFPLAFVADVALVGGLLGAIAFMEGPHHFTWSPDEGWD